MKNKKPYTEKDISLSTKGRNDKNEVKLKRKLIGYWHVRINFLSWDACSYFEPLSILIEDLHEFDAGSIYALKTGLLKQLNKTS